MKRKTTEEFVEQAKNVHGDKYDYSKVIYESTQKPVEIVCKIHGSFFQRPLDHLHGQNCPHCSHRSTKYTLEEFINKAKEIHGNRYDYSKENLSWLGKQSLDFYLPKYDIAIECQGIQHFEPIEFFGGEKTFEYRKILDRNKLKLCTENNVNLFYINYNDKLENKINELIEICIG